MLRYVMKEEDMASADKVIHEYDRAVATNKKQLLDAEADAKGKR